MKVQWFKVHSKTD